MSHLTPCPGCERHVRVHEAACPFCKTALDLANVPPPALPTARLGRAALFAFGVTLAAGAGTTACGDGSGPGPGSGGSGGGGAGYAPAYGIPAGGTAGAGTGGEAGGTTNTGGLAGAGQALYGAAPGD
jgi:hypothetical protein